MNTLRLLFLVCLQASAATNCDPAEIKVKNPSPDPMGDFRLAGACETTYKDGCFKDADWKLASYIAMRQCFRTLMDRWLDERLVPLKKASTAQFRKEMDLQASFNRSVKDACKRYERCPADAELSVIVCEKEHFAYRAHVARWVNAKKLTADLAFPSTPLPLELQSYAAAVCELPDEVWVAAGEREICRKSLSKRIGESKPSDRCQQVFYILPSPKFSPKELVFTIHSNLPPFRFRFLTSGDGGSTDRVTGIEVKDSKSGHLFQTLELSGTHTTLHNLEANVSADDVNFDGYLDLNIVTNMTATAIANKAFFVFDPKTNRFSLNSELGNLPDLFIDKKRKAIYSGSRYGASRFGNQEKYIWDKGSLILIWQHEVAPENDAAFSNDDPKVKVIERKRIDGQLKTIVNKACRLSEVKSPSE